MVYEGLVNKNQAQVIIFIEKKRKKEHKLLLYLVSCPCNVKIIL